MKNKVVIAVIILMALIGFYVEGRDASKMTLISFNGKTTPGELLWIKTDKESKGSSFDFPTVDESQFLKIYQVDGEQIKVVYHLPQETQGDRIWFFIQLWGMPLLGLVILVLLEFIVWKHFWSLWEAISPF